MTDDTDARRFLSDIGANTRMEPERDVSVSRRGGGRDGERHADSVGSGRDERVVVLGAAAVLLTAIAVVGARVGTETLAMIDTLAAESASSAPFPSGSSLRADSESLRRTSGGGRPGPHLVAAAIAVRFVRDASVLAGGIAVVLGCWVAFVGGLRVLGSR